MAQQQKREFRKPREREEIKDEFDKKMLDVRRVTKVVKGGRTMRFSALVIVGDKKGRVGMGLAKAAEVPAAIEKALFWYEQAALRDYAPAQKKLSEIFAGFEYKTPDLVKAAGWLYVSLLPLFPNEKDLTKVSPELENLFSQMTQEEKEKALYFAYSFRDEHKK